MNAFEVHGYLPTVALLLQGSLALNFVESARWHTFPAEHGWYVYISAISVQPA
jgi:hypothetical protein